MGKECDGTWISMGHAPLMSSTRAGNWMPSMAASSMAASWIIVTASTYKTHVQVDQVVGLSRLVRTGGFESRGSVDLLFPFQIY
jgi:hypothetical protein